MLFTDPIFLFYFLPAALLVVRLCTRNFAGREFPVQARLAVFCCTLVFYGFREPWWLLPFCICIVFDFFWASRIAASKELKHRKFWLILSVSQNVGMLALFKYRTFLLANLSSFGIPIPDWQLTLDARSLALPAGISFYTFESLSFVIDVYRREISPPKSISEFFGFIGMFPRFVAGPIVRYRDMISQFQRYRGMQVEPGLFLFLYGLFVKVVFADNFEVFTAYAFKNPEVGFFSGWVGATSYSLQIYCDFSGYSLMAIGLGRILGFQFPTNFNRPYLAVSAQDFWRRWHISLSSWLRDYLYISLGGNRKGRMRTYVNLFLTMLLGGLWHGSSWNFVLWGGFHGVWLALERVIPLRHAWPKTVNQIVNFGIVTIAWVFFRCDQGVIQFGPVLKAMLVPTELGFNFEGFRAHPISLVCCIVGLFHCFVLESRLDANKLENIVSVSLRKVWLAIVMLGSSVFLSFSEKTIPFIYFQF